MKLTKYFTGKFINIFLKKPIMFVGGFLIDEDANFLYITEQEGQEVSTAIPKNNIGMVSLEDEITFLMEKLEIPDGQEPQ